MPSNDDSTKEEINVNFNFLPKPFVLQPAFSTVEMQVFKRYLTAVPNLRTSPHF